MSKKRPRGKKRVKNIEDILREKQKKRNWKYKAKLPPKNSKLSNSNTPILFSRSCYDLTELDMYILDWIKSQIISNGYPPTLTEIMEHYGFKHKNNVRIILAKLEEYGFLAFGSKGREIRIHEMPLVDDLASQRLKQWLIEATTLLKLHLPDDEKVKEFLKKVDIFAF